MGEVLAVWYLMRSMGLHRNLTSRHLWGPMVEAWPFSTSLLSFRFSLFELPLFVLLGPTFISSLHLTSVPPIKSNQLLLFLAMQFCLCVHRAIIIVNRMVQIVAWWVHWYPLIVPLLVRPNVSLVWILFHSLWLTFLSNAHYFRKGKIVRD